jgi:hypothetical protein
MDEEESRDGIPCPVDRERELRGADPPVAPALPGHEVDGVVRRLLELHGGHEHHLGSQEMYGRNGLLQGRQRFGADAREVVELELVWGNDVGRGQSLLPHELGDAGAHEYAAADIADHRVATIERRRIGRPDAGHRREDRVADIGRTHIAREHPVAAGQHAPVLDPVHQLLDGRSVEHPPLPGAVARMVGELDRMDRPHLDPEPLHRENGRGVAHMAIGNMRLNGEDIHLETPVLCGTGYAIPR